MISSFSSFRLPPLALSYQVFKTTLSYPDISKKISEVVRCKNVDEAYIISRFREFYPHSDFPKHNGSPIFGRNVSHQQELNQPEWDLENPQIDPWFDSPKPIINDRLNDSDIPWNFTVRDLLAWYVPASQDSLKTTDIKHVYGVHFNASLILHECGRICADNKELNGQENNFLAAFSLMVFWHEIAHGWIQDMSLAADVICNSGPIGDWPLKPKPSYFHINKKYSYLVWMEEAICNTAALNMMSHELKDRPWLKVIRPYIVDYMRNQPKGYRHFIDSLPDKAYSSSLFKKNILLLLTKVYGHNTYSAAEAVHLYMNYASPMIDPCNHGANLVKNFFLAPSSSRRMKNCPLFFHGLNREYEEKRQKALNKDNPGIEMDI